MRRILTILIVAVAAFAGLYSFYWFYISGQIEDQTQTWIAERRAEGYQVEFGRIAVTGFPAAFNARITDFTIGAPGGDWRASAPAIGAHPASVFDLQVWEAMPEGSLSAEIEADDGRIGLTLSGAKLLMQARNGNVVRTEAYADAVTLEPGQSIALTDALGDRIEDVTIFLTAEDPQSGDITIESAALSWGALDIAASGKLGADDAGYLSGALQMALSDSDQFITALTDAGILDDRGGQFARLAMTIAPRNEDGDVIVPLSFNSGKTYIGPAPVGDAPRIQAPDTNS